MNAGQAEALRRHPRWAAVLRVVTQRLIDEPEQVLPTLRLLADPDALPKPADQETVELARRLNVERLEARLDEFRKHAYTTPQVAKLLGGVTRQAVALRASNKRLLAREIGGRLYFPDWQFGPDGPLSELPRVVAALSDRGREVLSADALMRAPLPEEGGRTPARLLADGHVDKALHYISVAGGGL